MKIGITGGIGSGKSYVCKRLEARGIQVYDCDSAAKRLIRTSPELQQQLKALVGSLEKADMAKFLLESEQNAKAIDAIVHPAVFRDFEQSGLQWMESAILYESGAIRLVDKAIVVTAPDEVRIRRVMERDHISREKVLEWMSRQLPQDEVRRRAHFEIVNDGTTDIDKQIKQILNAMKETILAIAGKPGLYKLVTRGKNSLIVEALDATHRRLPAFATDRITSLGDVAMFTQTDDVPLIESLAQGVAGLLHQGAPRVGSRPCAEQPHQETHHLVQYSRRGRHHRFQVRCRPHRRRQHRRPQVTKGFRPEALYFFTAYRRESCGGCPYS